MKKEEKAKLKAMSFKEKRAYYKSKRMGWRKALHILKWAFAGFGAFAVVCIIIMIVQINTSTKSAVKAAPKPVVATGGGLQVTVLNGAHVTKKETITATVKNLTNKPMSIYTGETTDPIGGGFGLLSDQEFKMGDNENLIIKPHQTLKLTYGVGEGRKYAGKYMIGVGLMQNDKPGNDVVEAKFDSK